MLTENKKIILKAYINRYWHLKTYGSNQVIKKAVSREAKIISTSSNKFNGLELSFILRIQ